MVLQGDVRHSTAEQLHSAAMRGTVKWRPGEVLYCTGNVLCAIAVWSSGWVKYSVVMRAYGTVWYGSAGATRSNAR